MKYLYSLEKKLRTYQLVTNLQCFFSGNAWECRADAFSSQTLFISVFYMDMQYECDNAFPNLKSVPERFS